MVTKTRDGEFRSHAGTSTPCGPPALAGRCAGRLQNSTPYHSSHTLRTKHAALYDQNDMQCWHVVAGMRLGGFAPGARTLQGRRTAATKAHLGVPKVLIARFSERHSLEPAFQTHGRVIEMPGVACRTCVPPHRCQPQSAGWPHKPWQELGGRDGRRKKLSM